MESFAALPRKKTKKEAQEKPQSTEAETRALAEAEAKKKACAAHAIALTALKKAVDKAKTTIKDSVTRASNLSKRLSYIISNRCCSPPKISPEPHWTSGRGIAKRTWISSLVMGSTKKQRAQIESQKEQTARANTFRVAEAPKNIAKIVK